MMTAQHSSGTVLFRAGVNCASLYSRKEIASPSLEQLKSSNEAFPGNALGDTPDEMSHKPYHRDVNYFTLLRLLNIKFL